MNLSRPDNRISTGLLSTLIACGSATDRAASTSATDGVMTEVAVANDAGDSGPTDLCTGALTSQVIGPAGGELVAAGVRLIVPKGAVAAETTLCLRAGKAPAWAKAIGAILELQPSGTRFGVPVLLELERPTAAESVPIQIAWSLLGKDDTFQAMHTTFLARDGKVVVRSWSMHASTVFMCDPATPGLSGLFCCTPKSPATTTAAQCIGFSPLTGATCDASQCDLVAGACPTSPPQLGCCTPVDPQAPAPNGQCSDFSAYGNCVLAQGQGYCQWSTTCFNPTAPPPTCADCGSATWASDPDFQWKRAQSHAASVALSCAQLQAMDPGPLPQLPTADPGYAGALGEYCGYLTALKTQCGPTAGGCDPPGFGGTCSQCTNLAYTANPTFITAAQAGVGAYFSLSCAALGQQGVPPPSTPINTTPYYTELGRWCAFQEALNLNACAASATSLAPVCPTGFCAGTNALCGPPTAPCAKCSDPAYTGDPNFVTAAQSGVGTYFGLDCVQLAAQNVPVPSTPLGSVAYFTELGRWCAMQEALNLHGCANTASTFAPQCPAALCAATTGLCPSPPAPPCAKCLEPAATSNASFKASAQAGIAAYFSSSCAALAQQSVAPPTSAPATTQYYVELGRWCAFQEALNVNGCMATGTTLAPQCAAGFCGAIVGLCP